MVVDAVLVLLPVDVVELEVAAAVAGREESFASVYQNDSMVSVVYRSQNSIPRPGFHIYKVS